MPGIVILFFDISAGEIVIILIIVFLIFGPGKFPELARKIGKGINEMKRASESIKDEIRKEATKVEKEVDLENIEKDQENKDQKK